MPGSINGAVRQDIQPIYARGMDSSACATKRPAFIDLVTKGRNDPIAQFIQQPHQTDNAKQLVLHEAQKNLPADFLQKKLSPEGNKIRTLIGVIYKDVQDGSNPEDLAKLDKVCKKLAEANGNQNKEQKVAKELSDLASKYSAGAFEKVINKYIEHCMEAWEDHHQAKSVDTHDKAIFKQCLDVCKSTLKHDVEGLTQPDQPWETMAQKLNFFVNDCAAISKTLTFYDAEPVSSAPQGPGDAEPVPPAPQGPETLNPNPDGGADNQRVFIPSGPGQGSITLNITSQGGSVGDITHSVGAANTSPTDSNSAIVKHILDSGLTNIEKMGLIEDLFNANIGSSSNFLRNLAGVQGYKHEQAIDTPQLNKLGADSLDGVTLCQKKEPFGRASLSNGDFIYATSRNIDPLNRSSSTPTHFIPTGTEIKPERANGKVVTLADKFEALKQRDPSVFAHLDKNGTVTSEGEKVEPTTVHDVEKNLTDSLIRPEPESPLNSHVRSDGLATDRMPTNIKMANPGIDSTDGGIFRKNGEQVNRKSAADGFQPVRVNAASENESGNDYVYTTVRTVNLWDRRPKPVSFVPQGGKTDSAELDAVFTRLKPREQSEFDALENNRIELDKKKLPFQEKLAEFIRRREEWVTSHE